MSGDKEEDRKEKKRAYNHEYYFRHRKELIRKSCEYCKTTGKKRRNERRRNNYAKNRELYRSKARKLYARLKSDPMWIEKKRLKGRAWKKNHREAANESKKRWLEKNPEKKRQYQRVNYERRREKKIRYSREYREKHHDEIIEKQRQKRVRISRDPELYAIHIEKSRERYAKNKDRILACNAKYRAAHKRRLKKYSVWYRDRIKAYCRQDPEFYAILRAKNRKYRIKHYRKITGCVKRYVPRLSCRIPDTCCYDRVLDKRSVFIWNNLPAASIVAGRAYKAMQWRESHCDRFGIVVR